MAEKLFVSLFPNSSMSIFSGNTLSKFRVKLSQTLRFLDDGDVALAGLSLPFAIQNTNQGMNFVSLLKAEDNGQLWRTRAFARSEPVGYPTTECGLTQIAWQADCLGFYRDHFALTVKRGIAIELTKNLVKLVGVPKMFSNVM